MDWIEKALAERVRLLARLRRLDVAIEVARELDAAPDPEVAPVQPVPAAAAKAVPAPVGPLVQRTREFVIDALQVSGRAMGPEELLEMLRNRGMTINSEDPVAVLRTRLNGAPELISRRGIGWDLKSRLALPDSEASMSGGNPESLI